MDSGTPSVAGGGDTQGFFSYAHAVVFALKPKVDAKEGNRDHNRDSGKGQGDLGICSFLSDFYNICLPNREDLSRKEARMQTKMIVGLLQGGMMDGMMGEGWRYGGF